MCSYTRLGSACVPRGGAITSNAKFIAPGAQVYSMNITPMLLYPRHTAFLPAPIDLHSNIDIGPESIKAWSPQPYEHQKYGGPYYDPAVTNPHARDHSRDHSRDHAKRRERQNMSGGCTTCSGI